MSFESRGFFSATVYERERDRKRLSKRGKGRERESSARAASFVLVMVVLVIMVVVLYCLGLRLSFSMVQSLPVMTRCGDDERRSHESRFAWTSEMTKNASRTWIRTVVVRAPEWVWLAEL